MKMTRTALMLAMSGGFFFGATFASAQDCQINQPFTTPDQRFVDHGNGTVTDAQTGLMWKKCLEGQQGIFCYGSPVKMTWQSAEQLASNNRFAGSDGWRLPSVKELSGIVERSCQNPAINLHIFPGTPAHSFWSSSQSGANAWSVDFSRGQPLHSLQLGGKYVRLVRDLR